MSAAEQVWEGLFSGAPRPPRPATPQDLFDDLPRTRPGAGGRPSGRGSVSSWPSAAGPLASAPAPSEATPTPAACSAGVAALRDAVDALRDQDPTDLPGAQALADTAELLRQVEALRAVVLKRLADVDARKLSVLDGAPSTSTWVAQQHTSVDRADVALSKRLSRAPQVQQALVDGALTVAQAARVAAAVATARRCVDRPDGLIDGHDGEQVVANVLLRGVRHVVCEARGGLEDDDPVLTGLLDRLLDTSQQPVSQAARLEAAFIEVARLVETGQLTDCLGRLLDAVVPSRLEDRSETGHAARRFGMVRKSDGTGWAISAGELDDECGELLHTLLTAEMTADPDNPQDTVAFEQLRASGWHDGDALPADEGCDSGPRSLAQRRHDAFKHLLRRALDAGLLGARDKVAPHIGVTVDLDTLEGRPGALPARGASGASLALGLVRRWACDASLTRFVLSLGRKVVETSHTQRTLTGAERRIKHLETGGRCQGAGCSHAPGARLVPHHADPWAVSGTTSVEDTVLVCERTHRDIHIGGRTIRLRDGRWLGPEGWASGPSG